MNRKALQDLINWKKSNNRKPLIIRGARQVGKTTIVNQFSIQYKQYIYLNLERKDDVHFFDTLNNVKEIVESLFLKYELQPDYSNTLLFIDEIQESPKAIALLRYFYEDLPELHVISAGSLLEFSLSQVKSFPVGRVSFLYLSPLNFEEFLEATNKSSALKALNQIPISNVAQNILFDLFHSYALVGGMPEVIKKYLETKSFIGLSEIYASIWETYKSDVRKYAKNQTEEKVINHIMNSAYNFLDQRVTFQNFGNSNYKSREVGEAFRSLDEAKVIQLIYPTTEVELPAISDFRKKPRLQFLDIGLVNYGLNILHELIGMKDLSSAYKGALVPQLVTQELISINKISFHKPNFWVKEKKQSSSEVDLVIPFRGLLIPIEIKSGAIGKLRSLHQFMEQCPHGYAVRLYAGGIEINDVKTPTGKTFKLLNLPYFLGAKLEAYLKWFIGNEAH
jgi:predicted AAA+ superfamily ATPase